MGVRFYRVTQKSSTMFRNILLFSLLPAFLTTNEAASASATPQVSAGGSHSLALKSDGTGMGAK